MLAVIQFPATLGIFKGTGTAAERTAGFNERDRGPRRLQGNRRRHARQPAADHDDTTHFALTAFQPMRSFLRSESDTRPASTRCGSADIFCNNP